MYRRLLRTAHQLRWGLAARLDLQAFPVNKNFPLFSVRAPFTATGHRHVPPARAATDLVKSTGPLHSSLHASRGKLVRRVLALLCRYFRPPAYIGRATRLRVSCRTAGRCHDCEMQYDSPIAPHGLLHFRPRRIKSAFRKARGGHLWSSSSGQSCQGRDLRVLPLNGGGASISDPSRTTDRFCHARRKSCCR
jgi:hypothetical protein